MGGGGGPGSSSCLIFGSMTVSPCQPLLSLWKPVLLNWQYKVKPTSCWGVVCTCLQPWAALCSVITSASLRTHRPDGLRCPVSLRWHTRFKLTEDQQDSPLIGGETLKVLCSLESVVLEQVNVLLPSVSQQYSFGHPHPPFTMKY